MSYTTATNKLKITELDFDSIKTALKAYLQGQDTFKDYDFEGSSMSILLDILAYNTHYNGFYTNMVASEMFIDSATLRSSVVSLAKQLGYTPASRKGSVVNVDISITTGEASPTNILIPKGAKFITQLGTSSYTFLAAAAYIATESSVGVYTVSDVTIREGVSTTTTFSADGTNTQVFPIPNETVDIETLIVSLGGDVYQRAGDITEVTATSKIYFLQEGRNGLYEIYFGDGVLGAKPQALDEVMASYNISLLGAEGNGAKKFVPGEYYGDSSYVATVTKSSGYNYSSGGAEREGTASIRTQAPRQYSLQKRLVTTDDYRARLVNDYNIVDSVRVWPGEENDPPEYGTVFIAIKPKTGFLFTSVEKEKIKNDILKKRNMVSIIPKFVDPDYLELLLDCTVTYDKRDTVRSVEQLSAGVRQVILDFDSSGLGNFDQYFRESVFLNKIDSSEKSIKNSSVNVKLMKSFSPTLTVGASIAPNDVVLDFDNALFRPHKGHMGIISSSLFEQSGVANCYLSDKNGVINILSQGLPGVRSPAGSGGYGGDDDLVQAGVGAVDYKTGRVELTNFYTNHINDGSIFIHVYAVPNIKNINPKGNTIVIIRNGATTINMIEDQSLIESNRSRGY